MKHLPEAAASWMQVNANFNPINGRCVVEVYEQHRWFKPFGLSAHGGIWPFPMSAVESVKTNQAKQILLDLFSHLNDSTAEIADRDEFW